MVVQLIRDQSRKAQFFIITAVLVGGSLGITASVLENYNDFTFDEISSISSPTQFQSVAQSVDSLWYEEDWTYRRSVLIREQSDHRIESYPVRLELDTQQVISNGKMQSDCQDLRIVVDSVSVPYQIEDGTCNTPVTGIWTLVSLNALETKEAFLYYGNENVSETSFASPFSIDEADDIIQNNVLRLEANETTDHGYGFTEILMTSTGTQFVTDGVSLFDSDSMNSWNDMQIDETGPIYTTISLGPNHNFTMFTQNSFLRRDGGFSMTGDETLFYSTEDTPLDQWEAGDGSTTAVTNGPFSSTLNDDDAPYIAGYSSSDDRSLMMTTAADVDAYRAETGPPYSMGLTGDTPVTQVDYIFNRNEPAAFEAEIYNDPPQTSVGDEVQGTYFPMNGWQYKATVRIDEQDGHYLEQYPVDVFLRLGDFDVRDDCRDITVIRDENQLPYEIVGDCNSVGFDEPDDHTVRWTLDEGQGTEVNDTDDQFSGTRQDDSEWVPGRFSFGLLFDGNDNVLVDDGPLLAIDRSPFTISFWMRPTAMEEGELFGLPDENPSIRITQHDGDYLLEGVYKNESDHRFSVLSTSRIATMTNTWHHVAMRHDQQAGTISIYVDGTQENQTSVTGRMVQTAEDIRFGQSYTGAMDEIKLYKRALTSETIRDQQDLLTQLRMAVNVTPATTQYLDVYMGSNTVFDRPVPSYVDTSPANEPVIESTTVVRQEEGWTRLQNHLNTQDSMAGTIDLQRNGQCSDLSFDTRQFYLTRTIC